MTNIASSLLRQTLVSEQSTASSLQVHGLTKRFHGSTTPVFKNVCFNIYKGQSVALIGANGAGKSTLLRCCVRLIEPDEGNIVLSGEALSNKKDVSSRKPVIESGSCFRSIVWCPACRR